jgi:hypothetical protein
MPTRTIKARRKRTNLVQDIYDPVMQLYSDFSDQSPSDQIHYPERSSIILRDSNGHDHAVEESFTAPNSIYVHWNLAGFETEFRRTPRLASDSLMRLYEEGQHIYGATHQEGTIFKEKLRNFVSQTNAGPMIGREAFDRVVASYAQDRQQTSIDVVLAPIIDFELMETMSAYLVNLSGKINPLTPGVPGPMSGYPQNIEVHQRTWRSNFALMPVGGEPPDVDYAAPVNKRMPEALPESPDIAGTTPQGDDLLLSQHNLNDKKMGLRMADLTDPVPPLITITKYINIRSVADIYAFARSLSLNGTETERALITPGALLELLIIATSRGGGFHNITPVLPYFQEHVFEDYYYCDFSTQSYYVRDNFTYFELDRSEGVIENMDEQYSSQNPEYNYYVKEYEEGIANRDVPEAVLPNMYIYSLISAQNQNPGPASLGWQNTRRERQLNEVRDGYDRLITMNELMQGTLPVIRGGRGWRRLTDQASREFPNWLNEYGQVVKSSAIVLDTNMLSDLAQDYYNMYTPASEMSIYDQLNYKKTQFPMYIETIFPTLPTGRATKLIENLGISSAALNGIITGEVTTQVFEMISDAYTTRENAGTNEDQLSTMYNEAYDLRTRYLLSPEEIMTNRASLSTYSVEEWINGMVENIEGVPIGDGTDENERLPRRCLSLRDRLSIQTLRNLITTLSEEHIETYRDAIEHVPCTNETIAYKLIKKSTRIVQPSGRRENKLLQTFYFPNTSKESVIRFVDTQVKYNKEYQYEVHAVAIVYGSMLRCRTLRADIDGGIENVEAIIAGEEPGAGRSYSGRQSPYLHLNVQQFPYVKIVEYPVYSSLYHNGHRKNNTTPYLIAGTSFQDVKILDRPPMPPELQIHPYANNPEQLLIMAQAGQGALLRKDAVPFIGLAESEIIARNELGKYQNKFEYFQLQSPDLEFETEGSAEIKTIEFFRTTEIPVNRESVYSNFGNQPYKVLDVSENSDIPENNRSETFDFCDNLIPNQVYYYVARSLDVHGNYSNPSAIYEVELVYNSGVYIPSITLFDGVPEPSRTLNKSFARFLQVEAADIQTMVHFEDGPNGMTTGRKGFVTDSSKDVRNNHFLVRLTSKDTGRKLDFKLIFKETKKIEDDE